MTMAPYTCPNCFYESSKKSNLRNHFARKIPCAQKERGVPLTDEIKIQILARTYTTGATSRNATSNINSSLSDGNVLTNGVSGINQFDATHIDPLIMTNFRDNLESLIRTNTESIYKLIEDFMHDTSKPRVAP